MIDTQKEQERDALHSAIWGVANELRGSVDSWDFKQYVLGVLFYRFISENLSSYIDKKQREAGYSKFRYADLPDSKAELDRTSIRDEKGFFISPSELFENVCKNAIRDEDLNQNLERIFKKIEASASDTNSESKIKGLFDDLDVNSNKLGPTVVRRNERLVKLLKAINNLPIGNYSENSIDLFGEAYEYLMTMYAANAGKSGGEFFTPQEVSELLARITVADKNEVNKVYDPACGSGSLLLKFAKVLGKDNVRNGFYGQEINITTYNLCRINMFLHDINYEQFDIALGDTLTDPYHWDDEPFDAIVSNPPYSIKWDGDSNPILIEDDRFTRAGVLAPKSKADLAFVMHALSWLASDGVAAIVSFPGVMYRGGAEQKIRKYLIENNFVDAVIQLPMDLFFGTTIATCILVIRRNKPDNKILFIDATNEFVRGSAKNKLDVDHRERVLDCYTNRVTQVHFSRLVEYDEITSKDYNISVSSYVEPKDTREVVNIVELNAEIDAIVTRQSELRRQIGAIVNDLERDIT